MKVESVLPYLRAEIEIELPSIGDKPRSLVLRPLPGRYIPNDGESGELNTGRYCHEDEPQAFKYFGVRAMTSLMGCYCFPYEVLHPKTFIPAFRWKWNPLSVLRMQRSTFEQPYEAYQLRGRDMRVKKGETPGVSCCIDFSVCSPHRDLGAETIKHAMMSGLPLEDGESVQRARVAKLHSEDFITMWSPTASNPLHCSVIYKPHIEEFARTRTITSESRAEAAQKLVKLWEPLPIPVNY